MQNNTNSTLIAVLVIVVIGIVAWIAYDRGVFTGREQAEDNGGGLEINLGTGGDDSGPGASGDRY